MIFLGETPEGVPHKRPASDENEEEEEEEDQGELQVHFRFLRITNVFPSNRFEI